MGDHTCRDCAFWEETERGSGWGRCSGWGDAPQFQQVNINSPSCRHWWMNFAPESSANDAPVEIIKCRVTYEKVTFTHADWIPGQGYRVLQVLLRDGREVELCEKDVDGLSVDEVLELVAKKARCIYPPMPGDLR